MAKKVAGKLGMAGFDRGKFGVALKDFLVRPKLPPIPTRFGHFTNKGPAIGMLGNDEHPNCLIAGAAHEDMVCHYASGRPVPRFTDAVIVEQFFSLTGGKDEGLDPVTVARWRQSTGLKDADGNVHQVKAFALIDSVNELAEATYLFGAAGCGVFLPEGAEVDFAMGRVWDDLSGEPKRERGHYIPCIGRNSAGNFVFSTWGNIQAATPQWVERYMIGGVAYFSPHYLTVNNVSPEAFDAAALDDYLNSIPRMSHS